LDIELQLKGYQYRNRTFGRVQLECTGDDKVVLHFAGVSIVASKEKHLLQTARPVLCSRLRSQPVLLTGPAACGKSTFTKQYIYNTATKSEDTVTNMRPVPVLILVIDLASTMKEKQIQNADEDILKVHLESKHPTNAPLLLQMRKEQRLVVLLDGMDEAGVVNRSHKQLTYLCMYYIKILHAIHYIYTNL